MSDPKKTIAGEATIIKRVRDEAKLPRLATGKYAKGTMGWYVENFYEWLREMNFSEDTIRSRKVHFRRFISWCDERGIAKPQEITQALLERYQKHLYQYRDPETNQPYSVNGQRQVASAIRGFFSWMRKRGFIKTNPAADVELPRAEHHLPTQGLTIEQVNELMALPNVDDNFGIRDRAILETFYSTGIRRSELSNLTIFDVDGTKGTLIVRQGKGKQDRVVPIGRRAVEWIEKYITEVRPALAPEPDHGFMFVMPKGGPMRPRRVGEIVKSYMSKAGFNKWGSCHQFRHAFATHMLEAGAEIRALQQMLGHRQIVSTQVYANVTIRKLKEIHEQLHPANKERKVAVTAKQKLKLVK